MFVHTAKSKMRYPNQAVKVLAVLVSRRQYFTLWGFVQLYCVGCVTPTVLQTLEEAETVYNM
jgi:hypothetical protein